MIVGVMPRKGKDQQRRPELSTKQHLGERGEGEVKDRDSGSAGSAERRTERCGAAAGRLGVRGLEQMRGLPGEDEGGGERE